MPQALDIVLGALCSGGAFFCFGAFLLRRLNLALERTEYAAMAFVTGSACYSLFVFLLCATSLATPYVFASVSLLAGLIVTRTRGNVSRITFAAFPTRWKWLFGGLFAAFGIVYLVNALAPEMSPDGSAYHLPFVARYLRAHGFARIDQNLYGSLPQGIDLLFLPAVCLGGNSAASLVHLLFLLDLPLLMVSYGRRFGFPLPAAAAAFVVFASPAFGWDGTSAYVDVAAATILFALFYLLQIWCTERTACLLAPIGILAGFSFSAKYSAAIGIPYALGLVAWRQWRDRKPALRPALTIGCAAALFVLPWMIKNQIYSRNPLAPFANRIFPNPQANASLEQQYLLDLHHYHLTSWLSVPWELTVRGERLQGFFGPIFLLLPLALLSLRQRQGRRLWLAGVIFALPWFLNAGARFLIPAAPPLTLALALALRSPAGLWPAIAVLHGFLSWYATPLHYFDSYAPRLGTFPLRGALRLEAEDVYLARNSPGYRIDRMIERTVPRGEKVFSFERIPEAWTTREVLAAETGAGNQAIRDMLWTAMTPWMFPERALAFRFEPRRLRRVRTIPTAGSSGTLRSVSEFTRRSFSTVRITSDLRREAIESLAAGGIRYLLVSPGSFGANDFYDHSSTWGIELVGASEGTRLYALRPAGASLPGDTDAIPRVTVPPGRYDDADPRIALNAAWTRDTQFPDADQHTLSYSNIPGASASLLFHGRAVTYVYTRASNRGIAEVWIDGVRRDRPDLYSPGTVWRSQSQYEGLGDGDHTIEIRITGERNPRANNCFVDLDGLVVE
jgi:hypothetical protein